MNENDSVKLLKECDAGAKMAVSSIDDVLDKISDQGLNDLLTASKSFHSELGNEIHSALSRFGAEDKEPSKVAKGMSWIKTSVKTGVDGTDKSVADVMTDGCNMGVKSLSKYLNKYKAADGTSKELCQKLIANEETLAVRLRMYL